MFEIPTLEIHQFKDGRKRIVLGGIDLSFLVSDVEIILEPGYATGAKFVSPLVKPVFTYEE